MPGYSWCSPIDPNSPPPWGDERYVTTYTLHPLSRRQTVDLVEHVTAGKALPAAVLNQIVDKTDGIPLFVEELTKHVVESKWLLDAGECYQLTSPLPPLAIPETLQDSLMARLDRLASVKAVAQLGAATGREFSYALLRAVSPLSDTALQEALGQLLDAGLISQRGSGSDSIYSFKHALIQDAAYASMLRRTRQQVHQQIAQVLATQFPETVETQPELVAHHYTEADCHQEAVVYWQRAGERASATSAYVEAVAHFQKGLDILQPLPATTEQAERELALQLGLGASLIVSQGWTAPVVEHAYVRAYELCQQLGEPPALIRVLQGLRRLYALRGDRGATHKARELGEQLLALAQRQNDPVLLQEAHWALGQTLFYLGELHATRSHLEHSSAAYTPQPLTSQTSRDQAGTQIACLFYTDLVLWMLGYPDQALRASYDGLALAQELSHPFTLAFAFEEVAMLHQCRREVQATRQQTEAMMALANEQGFPVFAPVETILRAWTLTMEGEWHEAIAQIQQAMAALRAGIDNSDWALHYAQLAEAYGAVGQPEEGLRSVAEALALIEQTGFRVYEPELHRVQGELLLQQAGSDVSQVEACFHQALDVARRQQAKSWELRAATSLARLWQAQGKRQDAYDLLAPVYGWFTEGFDTADLQEAMALLEELQN
jgi:predicted ATPase